MKKMKFAILTLIVIPFLTNCGNKEPASFTISTSTAGVKIEPNTAHKNQDYSGTILITQEDKLLPNQLDYVRLATSKTSIEDYRYEVASDALSATFTIPAKDITDNIEVGISLSETVKWFVSFDTDGGDFIKSQRVADGMTASRPTKEPTKPGYTFDGWYKNGEVTEFDFDNTPINQNTVIKAKWKDGPAPISYRFKFNGAYCAVNGSNRYETDVLINAATQFAIIPNSGYAYPKNDETHFVVTGAGKDKVSYDATTGVISISQMTGDITVTAQSDITDVYMFAFIGTNCTVNNAEQFAKGLIKKGSTLQFTIVPKDGYDLPTTGDEEQIKITGEHVTYANGIITISDMVSNVLVVANAPESTGESDYVIAFHSDVCKANIINTVEGAKHNLFATRSSKSESLTLYLFADDVSYVFPNDISVTFDDAQCQKDDYIYDRDKKTITIVKKANAMIGLAKTMHTITLDAGDGTFGGKKIVSVNVADGTNLSNFLRFFVTGPTLKDKTFAYYAKDDIVPRITYDDVVTEDIKLIAIYFDTATPYDNLDDILWSSIKKVAVTNPNPASCFNIGATKTIDINNYQQQVHVLDFNHDLLATDTVDTKVAAGITFEFVNLFSSLDGSAVTVSWNNKDNQPTNHDFVNSTLNESLGTIYSSFPDYLIHEIEDVTKYCGAKLTGTSFKAEAYVTKLFPLSNNEMEGDYDIGVTDAEGTQYEYYRQHPDFESREKVDMRGNVDTYWFRSPYTENDESAWNYHYSYPFNRNVTLPAAIAPAFCI